MKQRCGESVKVNSDEASPVTVITPSTCIKPGPARKNFALHNNIATAAGK